MLTALTLAWSPLGANAVAQRLSLPVAQLSAQLSRLGGDRWVDRPVVVDAAPRWRTTDAVVARWICPDADLSAQPAEVRQVAGVLRDRVRRRPRGE